MPDCEKIAGCPFFNDRLTDMPAIAAMLKEQYCQGDFANCARHMVCTTIDASAVPATLFPNMLDEAKKIIAKK